jgi:hypothetical protein
MKYYLSLLILCLFISGCGNKYIVPEQLNLTEYEDVVKELSGKKKVIDSLFSGSVDLLSFKKPAIALFPKTYQLLKDKRAAEIRFKSDNCLFIILKFHDGTFNIEREYLKIKDESQCKIGDTVLREIVLGNGWKYQLSSEYVAD